MFICIVMASFLSFLQQPIHLLIAILAAISASILFVFLCSLDYWTMFIIILRFLVGLFLLFIYLVSLTGSKTTPAIFNSSGPFFFYMLLTFSIIYITVTTGFRHFSNLNNSLSSNSWYEWLYQTNNEILYISILFFAFIVIIVFFFTKKNKKIIKKSF